ncbi:fibroblast growth factor receptor substrate 2-like [Leptodactylus fuscus]|uniref:fibroblast growth factor receptor substrate 2-like n=1 Tax=Leptodactylus fuscus TaxID=238119 RepID=UPI003F4EB84E
MGLCHCSMIKCDDLQDEGNRFRVTNVNDNGKNVCPGIMELTDSSMIFHTKGGFVKWPYISLLKYGYDSDLFSFVCSRRCQTGEGIFGFRCKRAEEMFNLLQSCMENNRISVISDTDGDSPVDAKRLLPYRYRIYPSFPAASSILPSHRPEPVGGELISAPVSTSSESSTSDFKEAKLQSKSHLSLQPKVSDGGMSQVSIRSYLDGEDRRGIKLDQACVLKTENEEMETLESIHSGELNGAVWDTGYDTDDRRETSCARKMGYENVPAFPRAFVRPRSMLVSVSSSDSQSPSFIPSRFPPGYFTSQPSSPCIFEEQSSLEQNGSTRNGGSYQLRTSIQRSSVRHSVNRSDCAPLYFNFDLRQSSQESKILNYIQVEMESGCDSDNPETPQSPDSSGKWNTGQETEAYAELDMEKTTALSLVHRVHSKDGTRRTRHDSKLLPV